MRARVPAEWIGAPQMADFLLGTCFLVVVMTPAILASILHSRSHKGDH